MQILLRMYVCMYLETMISTHILVDNVVVNERVVGENGQETVSEDSIGKELQIGLKTRKGNVPHTV